FHDADWALPAGEIAFFAEQRDKLAPEDPVYASVYLFNDDGVIDGDETLSYDEKRNRRIVERRKAVRGIWAAGGMDEIKKLLAQTEKAWCVGQALAEEVAELAHSELIPACLDS